MAIETRYYRYPNLNVGDMFPNFMGQSTNGLINFHDYIGKKWALFITHPSDFVPETLAKLEGEMNAVKMFFPEGVVIVGLAPEMKDSDMLWINDIRILCGVAHESFPHLIILDLGSYIAEELGCLDPDLDSDGFPLS